MASDESNVWWASCQVGSESILQVKAQQVRLLVLSDEIFKARPRAPKPDAASMLSLCNYKNQSVLAIGGTLDDTCSSTVARHDLAEDSWSEMPSLNVARSQASSCILGRRVYVFGGCGDGESYLNSIEYLKLSSRQDESQGLAWMIVSLEMVTPRINPVLCPLNERQIVLIGGSD